MKITALLCIVLASVLNASALTNNAGFVSMNIPATVEPGATFLASITLTNSGETTWTPEEAFVLGSESLKENMRWGANRMYLSNAAVAPTQLGVFTNSFTAPLTPGIQNFAWRPYYEFGLEYFGDAIGARIRIGSTNAFLPGDLVLMQVGDGPGTYVTAGSPMYLNSYATNGGAVKYQVALPTVGTNAFITGGNQFTAMIDLSSDRRQIVVGGYNTNAVQPTTVEVAGSTIPRAAGTVDASGNFILQARATSGTGQQFNGGTFRGVVSDGLGNFWAGAQNGGIQYLGTNSGPLKIDNAGAGAIRSMQMIGTNIYFSTSQFPATTHGIVAFNGSPTSVSAPVMVINFSLAQTNASPGIAGGTPNLKGFSVNTNRTVAYVIDARATLADSGIYRFNGTGAGTPASWSYAYRLNLSNSQGIPQEMVVDYSGPNPVIYATAGVGTATVPNHLITATDTGADSEFMHLLTADAGTVFRGITFAPSAAPATISIARAFSDVVIKWTGGILQSADIITGAFADVLPAPTSPFATSLSGNAKFYRVRVP